MNKSPGMIAWSESPTNPTWWSAWKDGMCIGSVWQVVGGWWVSSLANQGLKFATRYEAQVGTESAHEEWMLADARNRLRANE